MLHTLHGSENVGKNNYKPTVVVENAQLVWIFLFHILHRNAFYHVHFLCLQLQVIC